MESKESTKKNPIFITSVELKDYRSYKELNIDFKQNIHTLIGPNESGKTNLLQSFSLFNNINTLNEDDMCCFADNIKSIPEITFTLNFKDFPNPIDEENDKIFVQFKNGKKQIFDSKRKPLESIPNSKKNPGNFQVEFWSLLPSGNIHLVSPFIKKYIELPGNHLEAGKRFKIDVSPPDAENIRTYFDQHDDKASFKYEIKKNNSNSTPKTILDLMNQIKIIYWTYEDSYYIPYSIPLQNIKSNKSILNMFKIAGVKIEDLNSYTNINKRNMEKIVSEKVSNILKQTWSQYQNLELDLKIENQELKIAFLENGRCIDPKMRSLGFRWFMAFLLHFNAKFGNDLKNCVILLDEPGIHLHPGGQKDLLKEIEKLSVHNQIFYTTHSPFMINRMYPERLIYLEKKNGITELKEPQKEAILDDILLSSILGYNHSSFSRWGEINVLVEGITDKILITKVIDENLKKNKEVILDLNKFSLINIQGVSNLEEFIRVAQITLAEYMVFLDNDEKAKEKIKYYDNRPKKHPETIEHFIYLDDDLTIEDYIPLQLLNECLSILSSSNQINYGQFFNNEKFIDGKKIDQQIKDLVKKIKERINSENQEIEIKQITSQLFKLELIIVVCENINSENIDEFKDLIQKIKQIKEKYKKIYADNKPLT